MSRAGQFVERPRIRIAGLLREAWATQRVRPGRAALTALGTALGVGATVATLGISSTGRAQISSRFDLLRATEVRLTDHDVPDSWTDVFPADTDARLAALNGVRAAGVYFTVRGAGGIGTTPARALAAQEPDVEVWGATPGALLAERLTLESGRLYDAFAQQRAERVALVGRRAAESLGLNTGAPEAAIFVGGIAFTVVGIIGDAQRDGSLIGAVVVPTSTALAVWGTEYAGGVTTLIDVAPGAATLVGEQAPYALRPEAPGRIDVAVPPEPQSLRAKIEGDSTTLFYALAGLSLLIGAFGIAATTLVAVLERTTEIGLRRAVGALRRHIAAQFLVESASLGTVGGVVGAAAGVAATSVVALANGWVATMPLLPVFLAPLAGTLTGVVAGAYPALRAARVEPIRALTSL